MTDLSKSYDPLSVEPTWAERWFTQPFKADATSSKPPFTIVIPPPNITGSLHLGHALDNTIIDVLTLSFGCYHEDLPDEDSNPKALTATNFARILTDLGKVGIIVVAGAGNDATARPFVPAAFSGETNTGSGALPLVSARAAAFGRYPRERTASSTRAWSSGETRLGPPLSV